MTVRTGDRPHADPGREVHRVRAAPGPEAGPAPAAQKAVIAAVDPEAGTVTVRVLSGMGRKKEPEPGSLPEPGERVTFTLFELTVRQAAPLPDPDDTPWTHGGPPGAVVTVLPAVTGTGTDTGTAEDWE